MTGDVRLDAAGREWTRTGEDRGFLTIRGEDGAEGFCHPLLWQGWRVANNWREMGR